MLSSIHKKTALLLALVLSLSYPVHLQAAETKPITQLSAQLVPITETGEEPLDLGDVQQPLPDSVETTLISSGDESAPLRAQIAPFSVIVNDATVDQQRSLYPLLIYKEITYFPLTWNYSQALGLRVNFSTEAGLSVTRDPQGASASLRQDLLPEDAVPHELSAAVSVSLPTFPIILQKNLVDPLSEWPFLIYQDITYMPMTWQNAVTTLGLSYTYNDEARTLSVRGTKAEASAITASTETRPLLTGRISVPDPIKPGASLLKDGRQLSWADMPKLITAYGNIPASPPLTSFAFRLDLELSLNDFMMPYLGGSLEGFWDSQAKRLQATFRIDEKSKEDPSLYSLHIFDGLQIYMRPNSADPEELEVLARMGGNWIIVPTSDDPLPASVLALQVPTLDAEEPAASVEQDGADEQDEPSDDVKKEAEALASGKSLLEVLVAAGRTDQEYAQQESDDLLSLLEYEEMNGGKSLALAYSGKVEELMAALGLNSREFFNDFYSSLLGISSSAATTLSPEEYAIYMQQLQRQIVPYVDLLHAMEFQALYQFDAQTSLLQRVRIAAQVPADDAYNLSAPFHLDFEFTMEYDAQTHGLTDFSWYAFVDDNLTSQLVVKLALALDHKAIYDWNELDLALLKALKTQ